MSLGWAYILGSIMEIIGTVYNRIYSRLFYNPLSSNEDIANVKGIVHYILVDDILYCGWQAHWARHIHQLHIL